MAFPDSFTTARLRAERLSVEHLPEVRRMHRDPVVMTHLGGVKTDVQTSDYFSFNFRHWTEHNFGLWVLYDAASGDPAGRGVLRYLTIDGVDEVEVGYAFYQEYWGRGLATEVATALVRFGFQELDRPTLVAITTLANHGSQHVLRKAGLAFEREIARDEGPVALFRGNRGVI